MANLSLGIDIGGEWKFELYDLFIEMPTPLVPRWLRRNIPERLGDAGAVEILLE